MSALYVELQIDYGNDDEDVTTVTVDHDETGAFSYELNWLPPGIETEVTASTKLRGPFRLNGAPLSGVGAMATVTPDDQPASIIGFGVSNANEGPLSEPVLTGQLVNPDGPVAFQPIEMRHGRAEESDQTILSSSLVATVYTDSNGSFVYRPEGLATGDVNLVASHRETYFETSSEAPFFASALHGPVYAASGVFAVSAPAIPADTFRLQISSNSLAEQVLVNTSTEFLQRRPSLAATADGGFVAAWIEKINSGPNNGQFQLRAQRLDRFGTPVGNEIDVHGPYDSSSSEYPPGVAVLSNGKIVVAWHENTDPLNSLKYDVFYSIFGADGSADLIHQKSLLSTVAGQHNDQYVPVLAALPTGGFIATWYGHSATSVNSDVYFRMFDNNGDPLAAYTDSQTTANETLTNSQWNPSLAVAADGSFLSAWHGYGTGDAIGIYARSFNSDGTSASSERLVNTLTNLNQSGVSVATLADGRYVAVWHEDSTGSLDVRGRLLDATGVPLGTSDFLVNVTATGTQRSPAVVGTADGGFAVAWYGNGAGDSPGIFARQYTPLGVPMTGEVLINKISAGSQFMPDLEALSGDRMVFVWEGYGVGDDYGIHARVFRGEEQYVASITAEADTYVDEAVPAQNFGSAVTWDVQKAASSDRLGLLRFNLANINGDVSDATIRLFVDSVSTSAPHRLTPLRVNAWQEQTLTWDELQSWESSVPGPGLYGQPLSETWSPSAGETVELDVADLVRSALILPGDMNGDGVRDLNDEIAMSLAINDRPAFEQQFPLIDADRVGDIDQDGLLDANNSSFLSALSGSIAWPYYTPALSLRIDIPGADAAAVYASRENQTPWQRPTLIVTAQPGDDITLELLSDTGQATSGPTENPTMTGTVQRTGEVSGLTVEISYTIDGTAPDDLPEAVVFTDAAGAFIYRPEFLSSTTVQAKARVVQWDASGKRMSIGPPSDVLQFTYEVPSANGAPTVVELDLSEKTADSPLTAIRPLVTGRVQNDGRLDGLLVKLEFERNGAPIGGPYYARTDAFGRFSYEPLDLVPDATNPITVQATAEEIDPISNQLIVSPSAATLQFTLLELTNLPAEVTLLQLIDTSLPPLDPTVTGTITNDGPLRGIEIEFFHDADDIVDGTTVTDELGGFTYTPIGLPNGTSVTIRARAKEYDRDGTPLLQQAPLPEVTFTLTPTPPDVLRITEFVLVNDDGDSDDFVTSDTQLRVHVSGTEDLGLTLDLEVDVDGVITNVQVTEDPLQPGYYVFNPGTVFEGEISTVFVRIADGETATTDSTGAWAGIGFVYATDPNDPGALAQSPEVAAMNAIFSESSQVQGAYQTDLTTLENGFRLMKRDAISLYETTAADARANRRSTIEAALALFESQLTTAQGDLQSDLSAARALFQQELAAFLGNTTSFGLLDFTWPADALPAMPGGLLTDRATPPSMGQLTGPLIDFSADTIYRQALETIRQNYAAQVESVESAYEDQLRQIDDAENSADPAMGGYQQRVHAAKVAHEAGEAAAKDAFNAAILVMPSGIPDINAAQVEYQRQLRAAQYDYDSAVDRYSIAYGKTYADAKQAELDASDAERIRAEQVLLILGSHLAESHEEFCDSTNDSQIHLENATHYGNLERIEFTAQAEIEGAKLLFRRRIADAKRNLQVRQAEATKTFDHTIAAYYAARGAARADAEKVYRDALAGHEKTFAESIAAAEFYRQEQRAIAELVRSVGLANALATRLTSEIDAKVDSAARFETSNSNTPNSAWAAHQHELVKNEQAFIDALTVSGTGLLVKLATDLADAVKSEAFKLAEAEQTRANALALAEHNRALGSSAALHARNQGLILLDQSRSEANAEADYSQQFAIAQARHDSYDPDIGAPRGIPGTNPVKYVVAEGFGIAEALANYIVYVQGHAVDRDSSISKIIHEHSDDHMGIPSPCPNPTSETVEAHNNWKLPWVNNRDRQLYGIMKRFEHNIVRAMDRFTDAEFDAIATYATDIYGAEYDWRAAVADLQYEYEAGVGTPGPGGQPAGLAEVEKDYRIALGNAAATFADEAAAAYQTWADGTGPAIQTFDTQVAIHRAAWWIDDATDLHDFRETVTTEYVDAVQAWHDARQTDWSAYQAELANIQATLVDARGDAELAQVAGTGGTVGLANAYATWIGVLATGEKDFVTGEAAAYVQAVQDKLKPAITNHAVDTANARLIRDRGVAQAKTDHDKAAAGFARDLYVEISAQDRELQREIDDAEWEYLRDKIDLTRVYVDLTVAPSDENPDRPFGFYYNVSFTGGGTLDDPDAQAAMEATLNAARLDRRAKAEVKRATLVADARKQWTRDVTDTEVTYYETLLDKDGGENGLAGTLLAAAEAFATGIADTTKQYNGALAAAVHALDQSDATATYGPGGLSAGVVAADAKYRTDITQAEVTANKDRINAGGTFHVARLTTYRDEMQFRADAAQTATDAAVAQLHRDTAQAHLDWATDAHGAGGGSGFFDSLYDSLANAEVVLTTDINTLEQAHAGALDAAQLAYVESLAGYSQTQFTAYAGAVADRIAQLSTADAARLAAQIVTDAEYQVDAAHARRDYENASATANVIWVGEVAAVVVDCQTPGSACTDTTQADANRQQRLSEARVEYVSAVAEGQISRAESLAKAGVQRAEAVAAAETLYTDTLNTADSTFVEGADVALGALAEAVAEADVTRAESQGAASETHGASVHTAQQSLLANRRQSDINLAGDVAAAEGDYHYAMADIRYQLADALATSSPTDERIFQKHLAAAYKEWIGGAGGNGGMKAKYVALAEGLADVSHTYQLTVSGHVGAMNAKLAALNSQSAVAAAQRDGELLIAYAAAQGDFDIAVVAAENARAAEITATQGRHTIAHAKIAGNHAVNVAKAHSGYHISLAQGTPRFNADSALADAIAIADGFSSVSKSLAAWLWSREVARADANLTTAVSAVLAGLSSSLSTADRDHAAALAKQQASDVRQQTADQSLLQSQMVDAANTARVGNFEQANNFLAAELEETVTAATSLKTGLAADLGDVGSDWAQFQVNFAAARRDWFNGVGATPGQRARLETLVTDTNATHVDLLDGIQPAREAMVNRLSTADQVRSNVMAGALARLNRQTAGSSAHYGASMAGASAEYLEKLADAAHERDTAIANAQAENPVDQPAIDAAESTYQQQARALRNKYRLAQVQARGGRNRTMTDAAVVYTQLAAAGRQFWAGQNATGRHDEAVAEVQASAAQAHAQADLAHDYDTAAADAWSSAMDALANADGTPWANLNGREAAALRDFVVGSPPPGMAGFARDRQTAEIDALLAEATELSQLDADLIRDLAAQQAAFDVDRVRLGQQHFAAGLLNSAKLPAPLAPPDVAAQYAVDVVDGVLADYDFAGDLTPDTGGEPDPPKIIDAAFYSDIEGAMFARQPEYAKFTAQPPTTSGPIQLTGTYLGERALREILSLITFLFEEPDPTQLPGDVLPPDGAQSIADAVDQTPTEPAEGLSLANVADGVNDLPAVHTGHSGDSEVTADVTPGDEPTIAALEAESVELLRQVEAAAAKLLDRLKDSASFAGQVKFQIDLRLGILKGVFIDGAGGDLWFAYDIASFGVSTAWQVNQEILDDVKTNPLQNAWKLFPFGGYQAAVGEKLAQRAANAFVQLRQQVIAAAEQLGTLYGSIDAAQLVADAEAIAEAYFSQNTSGLDRRQLELFWRVNNLMLQVNIELLELFAKDDSPINGENLGRILGLFLYEAIVDTVLTAAVTVATEGAGTAPVLGARILTLIKKLESMGDFTAPVVAALKHGSPLRQKVDALFDAAANGRTGSRLSGPANRLIGTAEDSFGPGRRMLDLPVTLQPSKNTCVGACLDMLLPGRRSTIIESHDLRPRGVTPAAMVAFIYDNLSAAGLRISRGSVEEAIASGSRFIAIVDDGHAVVVDGVRDINGVRHVIVRDPAIGSYLERLDWFLEQRVVRDPDNLGFPAIWGE